MHASSLTVTAIQCATEHAPHSDYVKSIWKIDPLLSYSRTILSGKQTEYHSE